MLLNWPDGSRPAPQRRGEDDLLVDVAGVARGVLEQHNLDLVSVQQLVDALAAYRGALLVVSHDRGFLARLGLDTEFALDQEGGLTRCDHQPAESLTAEPGIPWRV